MWEVPRLPNLQPEVKWILTKSIAQPLSTDIVRSRLGRCSSLLQVENSRSGLCVTCGLDLYQKAMRVSSPPLESGQK